MPPRWVVCWIVLFTSVCSRLQTVVVVTDNCNWSAALALIVYPTYVVLFGDVVVVVYAFGYRRVPVRFSGRPQKYSNFCRLLIALR